MTSARWHDPLGEAAGNDGRSAPPARVGQILRALAARRRWESNLVAARISAHWEEIVGKQIASHSHPVRLRGGVLVLRAESSLWAGEVRMLGAEIADRVNQLLGTETVTKISLVTKRENGP